MTASKKPFNCFKRSPYFKKAFAFFIFFSFTFCIGGETIPSHKILESYFSHFKTLSASESWQEILLEGSLALEAAKALGRASDEAKICAQLTSTTFYLGDYKKALGYATRCHTLSEHFEDPSLFIRSLYLESAIHRALASKETHEASMQEGFLQAVSAVETALQMYQKNHLSDCSLKGKLYFNLGAAHADNPTGNLHQALECYLSALECFNQVQGNDACDRIRTYLRLGKVYLLQKQFDKTEDILKKVKPQIFTKRLSLQADYLEAQLRFALGDLTSGLIIAKEGLQKAESLQSQEDIIRFNNLINNKK